MKLAHFRDVLAVAERGSVRAAARQLNVAQPTLTRSIQELERELGVVLFERGVQGARLTEMGKRFVVRAHTVMTEIRRARDEIGGCIGVLGFGPENDDVAEHGTCCLEGRGVRWQAESKEAQSSKFKTSGCLNFEL